MSGDSTLAQATRFYVYPHGPSELVDAIESVRRTEETELGARGSPRMSPSGWARVSGAMGIPFVVGFVLLGALSGDSPDYKSSDSKILDWYASHSHRVRDIAGIFVLAVSAVFFLWFLGQLRATLRAAEGAGDARRASRSRRARHSSLYWPSPDRRSPP
jgi:hypothetical protein